MKTLSIRQPWAWLIVRPDILGESARAAAYAADVIKPVENRSWPSSYRGPLFIHASKYIPFEDEITEIESALGLTLPDDFEVGGIIGRVQMTDCVEHHPSRFFFGPFGFVFADATPLAFHPVRGALGFFDVPENFDQRAPVDVSVVRQSKLL